MKRVTFYMKVFARWSGLMLVGALLACNNNPPPVSRVSAPRASLPNITDAKRLSDGANKLLDAMNKPTESFHFSFKAQENINDQYPRDQSQSPRVGPVSLQAEISPTQVRMTESRGTTLKTSKAERNNEIDWAMANLKALGVMTSPNLAIALGSTVASPPTADLVGSTPADKFVFDTTTATTHTQKMGLDAARAVLTTMKDCKGTAWIAKDSGVLIKFSVDADYQDRNNHIWKEHYEGSVTRK